MKEQDIEKSDININAIKDAYLNYSNEDLLFADWNNGEEHDRLRKIIKTKLDEVEQITLLLYTELGSYRRVGEMLGVSATTIFYKIKEIRGKLKINYERK